MSWKDILKDDDDDDDGSPGPRTNCKKCRRKGNWYCRCPPEYDEDYEDGPG